jgi:hypothetical protein
MILVMTHVIAFAGGFLFVCGYHRRSFWTALIPMMTLMTIAAILIGSRAHT